MAPPHKKITNPPITKDRVRGIPLHSTGLQSLPETGIVSIGIDERTPRNVWGEGLSPTRLLFWVLEGVVVAGTTANLVRATSGQLLHVPPCCPKRLRTERRPLRACWLHLRSNAPLPSPSKDRPTVQNTELNATIHGLVQDMMRESARHDASGREVRRLQAALFLHYLQRELGLHTDPALRNTQKRLAHLWMTVNADLSGDWPLERMAALLHVSTGHCHRLVARHYDTTPAEKLRVLRLERAAELLASSNETLDRIAERVGYGSAYAFSKAFLNYFGCRPGAYRRDKRK